MVFVSVTRLRIRSLRFMPGFAVDTLRALSQVKRAAGFLEGALLPDRSSTYWTLTMWESEASMRAYIVNGAHKKTMPKLMGWCDEASVVHWTQADAVLPGWAEADRRMRAEGRASKVTHPSEEHAGLRFQAPRTTGGAPIRKA